ncbi:hypothetical protein V2W45_1206764, partial [Cenococcum geophilum]
KVTCFTTHWPTPVTGPPHHHQDASSTKSIMALMQNPQLLQKEGRLLLTKYAIQNNQFLSVCKATKSYNIPRITLRHRIKG